MKLLDIDHTVAKGVENIVKMGVTMLTIHAYPLECDPSASKSVDRFEPHEGSQGT